MSEARELNHSLCRHRTPVARTASPSRKESRRRCSTTGASRSTRRAAETMRILGTAIDHRTAARLRICGRMSPQINEAPGSSRPTEPLRRVMHRSRERVADRVRVEGDDGARRRSRCSRHGEGFANDDHSIALGCDSRQSRCRRARGDLAPQRPTQSAARRAGRSSSTQHMVEVLRRDAECSRGQMPLADDARSCSLIVAGRESPTLPAYSRGQGIDRLGSPSVDEARQPVGGLSPYPSFEVERQIHRRRRVRERADRDPVDARFGDRAHRVEIHAARRLENRAPVDELARTRPSAPAACCRAR